MKKTISIMVLLTLVSLAKSQNRMDVKLVGNTNQIMKMYDLHANINPDTIKNKINLFGIGAAENLQGEMMILDGKPYYAGLTQDRKPYLDNTFNKNLIFLVSMNVPKWRSQKITKPISSKDELIAYIFSQAAKNGIDTNSAFPFLIKGKVKTIKAHIAYLKDEHIHKFSPQIKKQDDYPILLENKEVTILGFASTDAGGLFAMPQMGNKAASKMHIHFISKDKKYFGHIEDLLFIKGLKLYFPKI